MISLEKKNVWNDSLSANTRAHIFLDVLLKQGAETKGYNFYRM